MLAIDELELEIQTRSPSARRLRVVFPRRAPAEEIARIERLLRAHPAIVEVRADLQTRRALVRYAPEAALPIVERARPPSDTFLHAALETVRGKPRPVALPAATLDDGQPWHALDLRQVLERLGSTEDGLDDLEAQRRLRRFGLNAYEGAEPRSRLEILLAQLSRATSSLAARATSSLRTRACSKRTGSPATRPCSP